MASKFFIGYFEKNEQYVDDISIVAYTVLTSPSGFWFDLFTSVPWSYFDVMAYQASGTSDVLFRIRFGLNSQIQDAQRERGPVVGQSDLDSILPKVGAAPQRHMQLSLVES